MANTRDVDPVGKPAPQHAAACACHGGHGGSDQHDTGGSAACGGRDGDWKWNQLICYFVHIDTISTSSNKIKLYKNVLNVLFINRHCFWLGECYQSIFAIELYL